MKLVALALLALLAAALLAGCTAPVEMSAPAASAVVAIPVAFVPPTDLVVCIDSTFRWDWQRADLEAALAMWAAVTPVTYTIDATAGCGGVGTVSLTFSAAPSPEGDAILGTTTWATSTTGASTVFFPAAVNLTDPSMVGCFAHEIGHVLGLQHDVTHGSVLMTPDQTATTIQQADVDQFNAIHGGAS